jgi:hypothetical protein
MGRAAIRSGSYYRNQGVYQGLYGRMNDTALPFRQFSPCFYLHGSASESGPTGVDIISAKSRCRGNVSRGDDDCAIEAIGSLVFTYQAWG